MQLLSDKYLSFSMTTSKVIFYHSFGKSLFLAWTATEVFQDLVCRRFLHSVLGDHNAVDSRLLVPIQAWSWIRKRCKGFHNTKFFRSASTRFKPFICQGRTSFSCIRTGLIDVLSYLSTSREKYDLYYFLFFRICIRSRKFLTNFSKRLAVLERHDSAMARLRIFWVTWLVLFLLPW